MAHTAEHSRGDDRASPNAALHEDRRRSLDSLDYPGALALNLPIGSGMLESGHRHVLKKAGTAWLSEHADQIAHLRVLRANHQWLSLWNKPHPFLITTGT